MLFAMYSAIFTFLFIFNFFWQVKALRLKELADDIKNQRLTQKSGTKSREKSNQVDFVGSDLGRSHT
jgi:hypothetical protein